MMVSSISSSNNYMQVATSHIQPQGRNSNPSATQQIIEAGREAVPEPDKGGRIDLKA